MIAAVGPVIGFVVTGFMFLTILDKRVSLIDQRMANAEGDLKEMATGVRQLARDNTQIVALAERTTGIDQRLTEMSHRISAIDGRHRSRS